jgi:hypothetical protein
MKEANDVLQSKIATEGAAAVNIEAVDEEQPHILMVRGPARHGGVASLSDGPSLRSLRTEQWAPLKKQRAPLCAVSLLHIIRRTSR